MPTLGDLGFSQYNRRENLNLTKQIDNSSQVIPDSAISYNQVINTFSNNENQQSSNFLTGSAGWQINGDGSVEFNSGTFRGSLIAGQIHIPDTTTANSFHTDSSGNSWWGANVATGYAGAPAYVLATGSAKFSSVTLSGSLVVSTSGSISSGQTAYNTGTGYWIEYNGGTPRLSIGNGITSYLTWSGTAFTIYGAVIGGLAAGSEAAIQSWTFSGTFSVTDADTIAWTSGTLTMMSGQTYSISAGNTGNMSAFNYIYLDISTSVTVFQVATTFTAGSGKVLIAVAQNGTSEASYLMMGGSGAHNLDGSTIAAGSIIAGKLAVTQLSAISANLGTITAGNITLDSSGYIRGGQTAYNTGFGFFLGYDISVYKLSIGNSLDTTKLLLWDGTDLIVNNSVISNNNVFGDGSDGDVTISGDTSLSVDMFYDNLTINTGVILNPNGYRIFVKNTLTLTGTGKIARNGANGGNGGNGGGGGATAYGGTGGTGGTAGTAGGALADGSIKGAVAGANGGDGGYGAVSASAAQNAIAGVAGSAGSAVVKSIGSAGSTGNTGGAAGSASGTDTGTKSPSSPGGGGAAGAQSGTVYNQIKNLTAAYLLYDFLPTGDNLRSSTSGGGSGGGGGGGAGWSSEAGFESGAGGGGGGGGASGSVGGIVCVFARKITGTGTIEANGGTGGNGGNGGNGSIYRGSPATGEAAGAGGGGGSSGKGGTGGVVIVAYSKKDSTIIIQANGGTGGTGGNGGTAYYGGGDATATNGTTGTSSVAGASGKTILFQV